MTEARCHGGGLKPWPISLRMASYTLSLESALSAGRGLLSKSTTDAVSSRPGGVWWRKLLANLRYKPPDQNALPNALRVVAHAKEVSHPDN
jgi:hypothetical protein